MKDSAAGGMFKSRQINQDGGDFAGAPEAIAELVVGHRDRLISSFIVLISSKAYSVLMLGYFQFLQRFIEFLRVVNLLRCPFL